jgi:glycosyltransferase involved in cell wall biosynthesis
MNIFVVPSWYPSQKSPSNGIFVKEEVDCLARNNPEINFIISNDGGLDYSISPKDIYNSLSSIIKYFFNKPKILHHRDNLFEYSHPSLKFPTRILNGNIKSILSIHRSNLKKSILNSLKPDIIHAHVVFPAGWVAMQLSKEFGIPYIIKECMGPFPFNTKLFISPDKELTNWVRSPLTCADHVIVMSHSLSDEMKRHNITAHSIIPYPVDEDIFCVQTELVRSKTFTFFTLSSISTEKGIYDLLQAISTCNFARSVCTFKIGGVGREMAYFQDLALKLGISDIVEWLGHLNRQEAAVFFQKCDCFIMLSHSETFGMVYAEAIACGKPVIATRCGGAEDIINMDNGLLVDIGNVGQISIAIKNMLENYQAYDPILIRADFLNRFSTRTITRKIVSIYHSIVRPISYKD